MNILYVPMHFSLTYILRGFTLCGFVTADGLCYIELKGGWLRAQTQTHRPLKRRAIQLTRAGLRVTHFLFFFAVSQGTL